MTVANDALLLNLGMNGYTVVDALVATATTQATATKCIGQVSRFIKVGVSGAAVLPQLTTEEASTLVYVVNDDTTNALSVFPFTGETRQGTPNSALSVPAGQSAIFVAVVAAKTGKGGGIAPGSFANDWRSAVIP